MKCLATLLLTLVAASPESRAQALPGLEEVREARRTWQARVTSFRVASRQPVGPGGHYIYGELWGQPGRLALDSAHGWDDAAWQNAYSRNRSFVLGDSYRVDWPNKLAFETRDLRPNEKLERFDVDPWWRGSGVWPEACPLPIPEFYGAPVDVTKALEHPGYRAIRWETRRGRRCLRIEQPRHDHLWLIPEQGYTLWEREQFLDGRLAMRIECEKLKEAAAGIFLPIRFRIRVFLDAHGNSRDGEPLNDMRVQIEKLELNSLGTGAFETLQKPGLLRLNRREPRHSTQATPGGLNFIRSHADRYDAYFATQQGRSRPSWSLLLPLCLAALTLAQILPLSWLRALSQTKRWRRIA